MKPKHGSVLLREWQEKNNYTGKQAAKVLECTHQQLSHWETMRHIPDADRRFDIERRTDGYVPADRWSNQ